MPKLSNLQRLQRLPQRLSELEAGVELNARELNSLLTTEQQQQLVDAWRDQQGLRQQKPPVVFKAYEAGHKNALAWVGKCSGMQTISEQHRSRLLTAQTQCYLVIEQAHDKIYQLLQTQPDLAVWLDREVDDNLYKDDLSASDLVTNDWLLLLMYVQLPILVSSRSEERLVTEEERFGWKSKRQVQIDVYRQAVLQANKSLLAEFELEMKRAERRRSQIYLDNFFAAQDGGKNAEAVANNALTRADLPRYDGQLVATNSKRDQAVWEMEGQLQAKAEAELTADEREQRDIWAEHVAAQKRSRKAKGL